MFNGWKNSTFEFNLITQRWCGARFLFCFVFLHRFYSMSPWHVSTANQTEKLICSTLHHELFSRKIWEMIESDFHCDADKTKLNELGLYIFIYIFSSSHRVQSHLLPLYCTFHTCLLTILSSSAPLLSSHSHSPLLLLSYWSVANSIKRYLSIAWLLGSINTGTSPN